MKYIYLTISTNENGQKYAFAIRLSITTNLINLHNIPYADVVQIMPTWKAAKETAERWNAVYKANGEFVTADPNF